MHCCRDGNVSPYQMDCLDIWGKSHLGHTLNSSGVLVYDQTEFQFVMKGGGTDVLSTETSWWTMTLSVTEFQNTVRRVGRNGSFRLRSAAWAEAYEVRLPDQDADPNFSAKHCEHEDGLAAELDLCRFLSPKPNSPAGQSVPFCRGAALALS